VKKSKKIQVLFFCLIPVGIVILIFSIRFVQKTFSGKIIPEIPYYQKSAEFILTYPGKYSIWHKGLFFSKAPSDEFKPEIINKSTGQKLTLSSLLFRANENKGKIDRMMLYLFSAPAENLI